MKKLMFAIGMFMYAALEGAAGGAGLPALTGIDLLNDQLSKLRADATSAENALRNLKPEDNVATLASALSTALSAVTAKEREIENHKRQQEAADKRKATESQIEAIADLAREEATHLINVHSKIKGQPTPEQMEAMNAKTAAVKDQINTVKNLVFGKPQAAATVTGTSASAATGRRSIAGAVAQEIVKMYDAEIASGKSDTEARKAIIAAGKSAGTTNATIHELLLQRKEAAGGTVTPAPAEAPKEDAAK